MKKTMTSLTHQPVKRRRTSRSQTPVTSTRKRNVEIGGKTSLKRMSLLN